MTKTTPNIGEPGWRPTEVHPTAQLFQLLNETKLAALAQDIKENGQKFAIVIDDDGVLIDGRNRLAACAVIGVEPRFESLNGQDAEAFIFSTRQRADMTQGQRAMVGAVAAGAAGIFHLKVEKPGRRGRPQGAGGTGVAQAARRASVGETPMKKAFLVRDYANDLVSQVLDATITLDAAHDIAQTRKRDSETNEEALARLRSIAPDLAARVDDGEIDMDAARKLHEKAREDLFHEQESLMLGLWQLVTTAGTFHKSSALPKLPEWLAGEDGADMAKRIEKFYPGGVAELQERMADVQAGIDAVKTIVSSLPSAKKGRKK